VIFVTRATIQPPPPGVVIATSNILKSTLNPARKEKTGRMSPWHVKIAFHEC
jgi:hypothetical protein